MKLRVSIAFALCVAAAFVAVAKPVSHERAMRGAEDWISRSKARHSLRAPSGEMRTVSMDGTNLFHFVALDGGGFVTVAADDAGPAIMGFSASGEMPELDEGSPLLALLVGDAEASRGIARRKGAKRRPQMSMEKRRVAPRRRSSGESTRTRLTASSSAITSNAGIDAGIDDMRVEPLIKSQWDQKGVDGKPTYNYYFTKYCCGCVATAMAQLMRYHEYPKTAVDAQTFLCYIGHNAYTSTNMTMKGGVYNWANMPLKPNSSISDAEREAIGRICYDAGVSMRMAYGYERGEESAAWGGFEHEPLVEVFGYKNASSYILQNKDNTLPVDVIRNGILANLDAKSPVLLGIANATEKTGHDVIVDGYGYADGTLYCHLNMGWSGACDYWYALPEVNYGTGRFTATTSIVYNIFPTAEGEIVSGRVTDPFGNPAAGATITARVSYLKTSYTTNVTVSANGVYSLIVPSKNCTTVLRASIDSNSWASTNASVGTTASVSPSYANFENGDYPRSGLSIGNSWGNDLSLVATNVVEASSIAFERSESSSPTSGFSLAFDGSCGAWYTVWQSEYLPPTWTVFTNIQVSAEGGAAVTLPFDAAKESSFYLITPKEQQ